MDSPKTTNKQFWAIAIVAIVIASSVFAAFWPLALSLMRAQSARLAQDASSAHEENSALDYQLAAWVNPGNQSAWLGLARLQLAANHPSQALSSLNQAGQGSGVARLQVRSLLELGRYQQALNASAPLTVASAPSSDLVLAGLTDELADQPTRITELIPRISAPEALQALQRAQSGKLPLAIQLYASGLPDSSRAVLQALPTSYESNLLLAKLDVANQTPAALTQAADLLATATALSPASLSAHQLLAQVYQEQGNSNGFTQQTALINRLEAGQP